MFKNIKCNLIRLHKLLVWEARRRTLKVTHACRRTLQRFVSRLLTAKQRACSKLTPSKLSKITYTYIYVKGIPISIYRYNYRNCLNSRWRLSTYIQVDAVRARMYIKNTHPASWLENLVTLKLLSCLVVLSNAAEVNNAQSTVKCHAQWHHSYRTL